MDHIIQDVDEEDDEHEVEVHPGDRHDEVERVHAHIVRDLRKEDNNDYVEVSEDEQVDAEEEDGPDLYARDPECDTDDE